MTDHVRMKPEGWSLLAPGFSGQACITQTTWRRRLFFLPQPRAIGGYIFEARLRQMPAIIPPPALR